MGLLSLRELTYNHNDLEDHKALLSSKLMNGRYIEFTYNGDLKKYYVDCYEKQEHSEFKFFHEERG